MSHADLLDGGAVTLHESAWPGQCFLIRTWVLLLFALLLFFSISFLVPAGV